MGSEQTTRLESWENGTGGWLATSFKEMVELSRRLDALEAAGKGREAEPVDPLFEEWYKTFDGSSHAPRAQLAAAFYAGLRRLKETIGTCAKQAGKVTDTAKPTPPPDIGAKIAREFMPIELQQTNAGLHLVNRLAHAINSAIAANVTKPPIGHVDECVEAIRANHPITGWKMSRQEAIDAILALYAQEVKA